MQKLYEDGNFQASYIKIRSKSILDYDFCFCFVVMVIKFGPLLPIIHPVYIYMHKWWCARLFRCTMRCAQFSLKGIQNENKKMRLNERAHIYARESSILYALFCQQQKKWIAFIADLSVCKMQGVCTGDRNWKLYYKFIEDNE